MTADLLTLSSRFVRYGSCNWQTTEGPCNRQFVRENPQQQVCPIHATARREQLNRERSAARRRKQTPDRQFALS